MSADDHLSPQQFYHGTDKDYTPGHLIDPAQPHERVHDSSVDDVAYFSPRRDQAAYYGRLAAKRSNPGSDDEEIGNRVRVYRVEPTGDYEPDRNDPRRSNQTRSPLRVVKRVGRWEGERGDES